MGPLPPEWEVYQHPSQRGPSGGSRVLRAAGYYGMLVAVYAILASLFTYPLISHLGTHTVVADASGDQFQTIWSFWWLKTAVSSMQNPYWTDVIYWPHGTGLAYHLSPFLGASANILAFVGAWTVNSVALFNFLVLLSYVVAGLGAYALIRHVTDDRLAAFCGSLFVAFAPFRLWHLNHLNLLSFGLGLFAMTFALRFLERPRMGTLMAAVLFLAATFYSSLTLTMLVGLFLIIYGLITLPQIWRHPARGRVFSGMFIGLVPLAMLCGWGLIELDQTQAAWDLTWQGTEVYSANLLGYILPGHQTSQTAHWLRLDALGWSDWGGEIFLGWFLVILSLVVSWRLRRRIPSRWLILAILFLILSLGPTLQIGSRRYFEGLMPYRYLFDALPYLNLSRAPARLAVLVHLGLTVVAGQGIAWALRLLREAVPGRLLRGATLTFGLGVLLAILFAEYTTGRIALWRVEVPEVYRTVAEDSSVAVIYEGPVAEASQICNRYMYWQTVHGKNVVNGYLTHHSEGARQLMDRMKGWTQFGPAQRAELRDAGVDAIVYHTDDAPARLIRLDEK